MKIKTLALILILPCHLTYSAFFERIKDAALNATIHPMTWAPLFSAGLVSAFNIDNKISDWAIKHKPIFKTRQKAFDYSNKIISVLNIADYTFGIISPKTRHQDTWLQNKSKRIITHSVVFGTAFVEKNLLKPLAKRPRPNNKKELRSMPSGHAVEATLYSSMINKDIYRMQIPTYTKVPMYTVITGTSMLAGWGKIESGDHYTTDVLIGMAIGNFCAQFFYELFMQPNLKIGIFPQKDKVSLKIKANI